jgi:hypothetical protein
MAESVDFDYQLALAANAAFKGLLGAQGQSGHICARVESVCTEIATESGWPNVVEQLVERLPAHLVGGEVVVLPDKVVAASLGRLGPRRVILDPDPKTIPPADLAALAATWAIELGFEVEPHHLLLADEFADDQATLGTDRPNLRCAEVAEAIGVRRGVVVDVVISDTDTGLDVRRPLIGTVTIAATPIGATAGVNLYEAMRCAVAAEFARGHTRRIPIVICVPADRRRQRHATGRARPYDGMLDAAREPSIAHA